MEKYIISSFIVNLILIIISYRQNKKIMELEQNTTTLTRLCIDLAEGKKIKIERVEE